MDHAAWLQDGLAKEDDAREAYRHYMRVDPDQREFVGGVESGHDELTGREMRWRMAKVGMTRGADLEKAKLLKVFLDPLPHIRIEKAKPLQGWYQGKETLDPVTGCHHRPRPCFTDAILTEPYGGYCTVGCAFCYVNSGFRGYRGSGLVSVPIDYGTQVERMLSKMRVSAAGYFSSFTDPFLPLEDYYHNSQRGAEAFDREGLPVFFLSRLAYPGWAIDLLQRNRHSYAQKSINTPDAEDWEKLSPGAISLAAHLEEIRELHRRGIYVSIQCNPIVPGITSHEDVELLFEMLAAAGTDHVIVKFVEAGYNWAATMIERMTKRFGANRAAAFRDLFVQNIGGERTVAEEYRMEGHVRYRAKATRLGMTYATCYEYRQNTDAQGKKISGSGVSVGKEFTTAAQCHGHAVPMFERKGPYPDHSFTAIAECPPSGCLHCADDNGGAPRCGSALLGAAKALRQPDLRRAAR